MNVENDIASHHHAPTWGAVGTLIWGALIMLGFLLAQVIVSGVYVVIVYSQDSATELENLATELQYNATILSVGAFSSLLLGGLLTIGAIKLKKNSNLGEYLALRFTDLPTAGRWLLIAFVFILLSDALTLLLGKPIVPEFTAKVFQSAESMWLLWIALLVAAPVFEEVFFRGFILTGFASSFIGTNGAILISSALWAAIHLQYDLYGIATIFVMGLMFGLARVKTGSILLTILLHSFANFIAMIEATLFAA